MQQDSSGASSVAVAPAPERASDLSHAGDTAPQSGSRHTDLDFGNAPPVSWLLAFSWVLVGLSFGNALWNLAHLPIQTLGRILTALALPGALAAAGIPLWVCGAIGVLLLCVLVWCVVATGRGTLNGTFGTARVPDRKGARGVAFYFAIPCVLVGVSVVLDGVTRALARLVTHAFLPAHAGALAIGWVVVQDELWVTVVPLLLLVIALVLLVTRPQHAGRHFPGGGGAGDQSEFTTPYRLLSDTCRGDGGKFYDDLGYESFAKTIARTILASTNPSLAISIEAEAGAGKTTAMRLIKQELEADGQCLTIWFDAWKYPAADIQRAFLSTVVATIDPPALRTYLQFRQKDIARTLVDVMARAKQMGDVGTLIAGAFDFEARYRNQFEKDFKTILDSWAKVKGSKQLVTIFIDDLDRCLPQATAQVFEAMKLFTDTPGCVFVYGFNPDEVSRRIALDYMPYVFDGLDHLSKFVQSNFRLPGLTETQVMKFIDKQLKLAGLDGVFATAGLESYKARILHDTKSNPRRIKSLLNFLVLRLPGTEEDGYRVLIEWVLLQYGNPAAFRELMRRSGLTGPQSVPDTTTQFTVASDEDQYAGSRE